jgi:hypothetical protein
MVICIQCIGKEAKVDAAKVAENLRIAYNNHDAEGVSKLFADDVLFYTPYSAEPFRGKAVLMDAYQAIWHGLNSKIENETILTSEDHFTWEIDMTGVFTNPLASPQGEIPPTGKQFLLKAMGIYKVTSEGLISEAREYFDTAAMKEQMGMI